MANLTIQKPLLAGAPLVLASAAPAGDWFPNTGVEFVLLVNAGAAERTVVFAAPGMCSFGSADALAHGARVVVPPVGSAPDNQRLVGPFPTTRFNDSNNRVQIAYDNASGVTLAVQASQ